MPLNCLDSDLIASLSSDYFGVDGGAIFNGDVQNPVSGVFDTESVTVQNGEGAEVLIDQHTFTTAVSQVPEYHEGDKVLIGSSEFTIRFWSFDNDDLITFFMERVGDD